MTSFDRLWSLPQAARYLKPGESLEALAHSARQTWAGDLAHSKVAMGEHPKAGAVATLRGLATTRY